MTGIEEAHDQASVKIATHVDRCQSKECLLETKSATILQFLAGLRGTLHVTFEEGTCAAWLYDLLK
ncbi:MAG: hypothetical protein ABR866_20550, partial [Candidatus Korobacteraceae bacterium]